MDPSHSLPLVAHGPPDQSAGGSPVTSRRPRDRDQNVDSTKVTISLSIHENNIFFVNMKMKDDLFTLVLHFFML